MARERRSAHESAIPYLGRRSSLGGCLQVAAIREYGIVRLLDARVHKSVIIPLTQHLRSTYAALTRHLRITYATLTQHLRIAYTSLRSSANCLRGGGAA
eukprot:94879-Prorocentrum_minimum.AAC.1